MLQNEFSRSTSMSNFKPTAGLLIGIFSFVLFVVFTGAILNPASSGAPASSTGAPGDHTCAVAGCHDDATVNKGTAISTIDIDGGIGTYEPGKTYTITVSIRDMKSKRFGYQMVALDENMKNAGTFIVTCEDRTQVLKNYNELLDRDYATYTYAGTEPFADGIGKWEIQWKAPATNIGKITFYCATASANNDGTDKGDEIYTLKTELTGSSTTDVTSDVDSHITLSPNPAQDYIHISDAILQHAQGYSIFDVNGRLIQHGNIESTIDIKQLPKGKYSFTVSGSTHTQSIHFIKY